MISYINFTKIHKHNSENDPTGNTGNIVSGIDSLKKKTKKNPLY